MKPPKGSLCRECPMRRNALPGYVGSDTPEHFIAMIHSDFAMPCHLAVDYSDPNWKLQLSDAPQCSGQAVYLSNVCKRPKGGKAKAITLPADREAIFSSPVEFMMHHVRDLSPEDASQIVVRAFLGQCDRTE